MEIKREFEVIVPENATPAEEEALINSETERQEQKLLDDLLGGI